MLKTSLRVALVAYAFAATAIAQHFPTKPIKIVVPFGAGGVADLTVRAVAQSLQEQLGQPVVVDNKPGAGGFGAAEAVIKSDADGHTLLLISNGTAVSAGLFKASPFDAERDLAPVGLMATFDIALVVPENSKFNHLSDFLNFAKANPGKLNVGSINIGSTQNLAAELLKSTLGLEMQIIPFNGTPAVVSALRGGTVDAAVEILGPVAPQVNAKALRVLATLGEKRAAARFAVAPTIAENTQTKFNATSWNGLAAPAKTPRETIAKLNQALNVALLSAPVRTKFSDLYVEPAPTTPSEAAAQLGSDIKRWSDVIRNAKIPQQ